MIKAKVNGHPVQIETAWRELSFRKYLKLIERGVGTENFQVQQSDVLSVMLDLPKDMIQKADFQGLDPVLKALNFLYTMPVVEEFPVKLGEFEIPKDITHHSVEQFETMEKYINKAAGDQDIVSRVKPLAMYCAIYCQPLNGDPFDVEKAEWLSERIMDYPCEEVMSVGTFFTLKFVSTKRNLPMSYLYKSIPARRKRRVLSEFLRRSGFTRLWTILRAIWGSLTKKP